MNDESYLKYANNTIHDQTYVNIKYIAEPFFYQGDFFKGSTIEIDTKTPRRIFNSPVVDLVTIRIR